jgi:OOP family OmpA-OmpF porin
MTRSRSIPVVMALAALAAPAVAQAQSQTETFALNRFNPSERGSDWFANESLDLRGHVRPFVGVVGDWSYKPLVLYSRRDGDVVSAIVRHQIFAHVGGGVILWERLRLAASMPLLVWNKGDTRTTANGTFSSSDGTTIGDLRLGADVRLLGEYGGPFTMAIGGQAFLPTGNEDAYASDGQVRLQPRLLGAGDLGPFAYAAQLGFAYRPHKGKLDDVRFGNEMTFAVGAGLRLLDKKLLVGPELYGSTVARKASVLKKRTTPAELIFGGKYQVGSGVRVGAGIGPGLTRGFGAPKVRVLAALEWLPDIVKEKPRPPSDRDHDGILDAQDACPDLAGEPNEDPKKNGCPPPKDRDGDGIFDDDDACPDQAGEPNEDPKKNGCPPADRDGDKILDEDDACPDEPGEPNDDPQKNGCPPPKDRDGDGILDEVDACPDEPGQPNADPKKNGCPLAQVRESKIVILERVEFETNSAKLLANSDTILNAVLKVMQDHPELTKVSVEGHTDNRGGVAYNLGLSKRRAASVVKWLVSHGIEPGRLASQGFGLKRPIDSNDTAEGRQNNRRVEFHIIEKDGKPVPQGDAK